MEAREPSTQQSNRVLRIGIAADHSGFVLREPLALQLRARGHEVIDFGATTFESDDDSPDVVAPLAEAVANAEVDRGVAICGFGIGACIVANKVPGIRASVCHDTCSARRGVEQDDLNLVVLGARVIGPESIIEIVQVFADARFAGGERHLRRLQKLKEIEMRYGGPVRSENKTGSQE
jgi:ribose 5-phosphate isomerase B